MTSPTKETESLSLSSNSNSIAESQEIPCDEPVSSKRIFKQNLKDLKEGVSLFGKKWKHILETYNFEGFTSRDLSRKWKVIETEKKKLDKEEDDK